MNKRFRLFNKNDEYEICFKIQNLLLFFMNYF